jgi:type 1 glutamine amidotransferase
MDYAVPWEDFGQFDLIILSREGHEYVTYFKERDTNPAVNRRDARWLTPAQERKFEDYVQAGGRLFLYHDGFGYYPKDGAVSRVAKAYFIRHPAIVNIQVTPTGKLPELTEGVTPFTVADEEYQVEMDESQTAVFIESRSPEHGRAAQGWAHSYGKGKVAVFIPGHSPATISHPMVQRCVQNITAWLTM